MWWTEPGVDIGGLRRLCFSDRAHICYWQHVRAQKDREEEDQARAQWLAKLLNEYAAKSGKSLRKIAREIPLSAACLSDVSRGVYFSQSVAKYLMDSTPLPNAVDDTNAAPPQGAQ